MHKHLLHRFIVQEEEEEQKRKKKKQYLPKGNGLGT